jgi:hypothetical protein
MRFVLLPISVADCLEVQILLLLLLFLLLLLLLFLFLFLLFAFLGFFSHDVGTENVPRHTEQHILPQFRYIEWLVASVDNVRIPLLILK